MIYSLAEKSVYSLMLGTFSPLIISIYYGLLILVIEYIVTQKIKKMIRINFIDFDISYLLL